MSSAWEAFVKKAIEGEPDDPFVDLLRERIASGSQVVRVNLEDGPEGPRYRILLSRLRQLSVMEVQHSPSFTRWSLETGARMASAEEEAQRFALLIAERFKPIADEFGADYADAIFLERVGALGPPRTARVLARPRVNHTATGREQVHATAAVDGLLASLSKDLSGALRYSPVEAAEILDNALERFALRHFSLGAQVGKALGKAIMRGGAKLGIK